MDTKLSTIEGRIAQFCEQTGCNPPASTDYEDLQIVDWCSENGASIDWIVNGDPASMIGFYRNAQVREAEFKATMQSYSPEETKLLTVAMLAVTRDGADFNTALEVWKKAVLDHRQNEMEAA